MTVCEMRVFSPTRLQFDPQARYGTTTKVQILIWAQSIGQDLLDPKCAKSDTNLFYGTADLKSKKFG